MVIAGMVAPCSRAQWDLQRSGTNADLRGIHTVGQGVAWASGTSGTVLRTQDDGATWHSCAVPPGAEHLDFRGIQAVDALTATVMSSGKGELSRLYKTTDGCRTWQLLFTNPDQDGFWDAILHDVSSDKTFVLGDPVEGSFVTYSSAEDDHQWSKWNGNRLNAVPGQSAFAASNSILVSDVDRGRLCFVTGGGRSESICTAKGASSEWSRSPLPLAGGESGGAFSVASDGLGHVVVVGGDYRRANEREGTAAFSTDEGSHFSSAETPPGGYRSAVAYDAQHTAWISVGPNGTDTSRDDGRKWRPLGSASGGTGPDRDWNALSLPFVVGPHGRIGKLRADVF